MSETTNHVYVRDPDKTVEGFKTYEAAKEKAASIPETETQRVRVRFRNRTGLYDVVVKTKKVVNNKGA